MAINPKRPTITYENIALFKSDKDANLDISNSGENISFIPFVQSLDFSFETERKNLATLGNKKFIDNSNQIAPDINLSVSRYEDFGDFFDYFISEADYFHNFYAILQNEKSYGAQSIEYRGAMQENISFGNVYAANVSISQSVNGLVESNYSFIASNIQAQAHSNYLETQNSEPIAFEDSLFVAWEDYISGLAPSLDLTGDQKQNTKYFFNETYEYITADNLLRQNFQYLNFENNEEIFTDDSNVDWENKVLPHYNTNIYISKKPKENIIPEEAILTGENTVLQVSGAGTDEINGFYFRVPDRIDPPRSFPLWQNINGSKVGVNGIPFVGNGWVIESSDGVYRYIDITFTDTDNELPPVTGWDYDSFGIANGELPNPIVFPYSGDFSFAEETGNFLVYSDSIQSFNLELPIERKSIYSLDKKYPLKRKRIYPNEGSFSFNNVVSDFYLTGENSNLEQILEQDKEYNIKIQMKNEDEEQKEILIEDARFNSMEISSSISQRKEASLGFFFDTEKLNFSFIESGLNFVAYDGERDVGYLGEVSSSDLISGDDLAAELGLTAGTAHNSDAGWLKFYVGSNAPCNRQGNAYILYVAKKSMRYNISWDDIDNVGGVDGTAEVEINRQPYKVRLMQGADADPSTYSSGTNCTENPGENSEWNELFHRVSEKVPDCANPSEGMEGGASTIRHGGPQNGSNWANFTNSELNVQVGNGRGTWCQEVDGPSPSRRVFRGALGVAYFATLSANSVFTFFGWRPCLQTNIN